MNNTTTIINFSSINRPFVFDLADRFDLDVHFVFLGFNQESDRYEMDVIFTDR